MKRAKRTPPTQEMFPELATPAPEPEPPRNKGGRPPGRTYDKTFLIRLKASELEAAKAAAEERGESLGEWIRLAITNRLRIQHRLETRDERAGKKR